MPTNQYPPNEDISHENSSTDSDAHALASQTASELDAALAAPSEAQVREAAVKLHGDLLRLCALGLTVGDGRRAAALCGIFGVAMNYLRDTNYSGV